MRMSSIVLLGLLALLLCAKPAHAASGYDNCTGFITSVPAVISTPGTWCMNQDVTTAISSGDAILIASDNVTLNCNDFRLDGSAAGLGTGAFGIHSLNQTRIAIRHCNVRGFYRGAFLEGTGGRHVVADNHFDNNVYVGLRVEGGGLLIRHNVISKTGGSTTTAYAYGMVVGGDADIIDNTVAGVTATSGGNGYVRGIQPGENDGGRVSGNRISGLKADGSGIANGILDLEATSASFVNNEVLGNGAANGRGIECNQLSAQPVTRDRVRGNVISGFAYAIVDCGDAGENDTSP